MADETPRHIQAQLSKSQPPRRPYAGPLRDWTGSLPANRRLPALPDPRRWPGPVSPGPSGLLDAPGDLPPWKLRKPPSTTTEPRCWIETPSKTCWRPKGSGSGSSTGTNPKDPKPPKDTREDQQARLGAWGSPNPGGARGRTRTCTTLWPDDFKSSASTYSATRALSILASLY